MKYFKNFEIQTNAQTNLSCFLFRCIDIVVQRFYFFEVEDESAGVLAKGMRLLPHEPGAAAH